MTAVGRLDRSGRLTFADRVFEPGERRKLKAWVDDLKTYGAQGSPEGKPLWGLTEEQFSAVYESVTAVTQTDDRGQPLEDAVRDLPIPAEYPLRWSDANGSGIWIAPGSSENIIKGNTFANFSSFAIFVAGDRNIVEKHKETDTVHDAGTGNQVHGKEGKE